MDFDLQIRRAAFDWLSKQVDACGDVLPRATLQKGFYFSEARVPLVSPQGIFTPKILDYPISITTVPGSQYQDAITGQDFILYKYRGENPQHRDNAGLRKAMELRLPLAYFRGIVKGKYVAAWPVYIIADDPGALQFTVAVDEPIATDNKGAADRMIHEDDLPRKKYITGKTLIRLHQRSFREKVIAAYRKQCALCRLKHEELLDAAHIIPDSEEHSQATVNNGISLCKLHHAAFDRFLIGITPDFKVEVKQEILEEKDGPMLQHGLKGLHKAEIFLPKKKGDWPDRDFLSERYNQFIRVSP